LDEPIEVTFFNLFCGLLSFSKAIMYLL